MNRIFRVFSSRARNAWKIASARSFAPLACAALAGLMAPAAAHADCKRPEQWLAERNIPASLYLPGNIAGMSRTPNGPPPDSGTIAYLVAARGGPGTNGANADSGWKDRYCNNSPSLPADWGLEVGSIGGDGGSANRSGQSGGWGGNGGNVFVGLLDSGDLLSTTYDGRIGYALYGYSKGGNGGAGASAGLWSGGGGGYGGSGGTVSLLNAGTLQTSGGTAWGVSAYAMYGLSVGGTGGEAGAGGWFGSSGAGGRGGNSGSLVTAVNLGSIVTTGESADAIHLRSVGGNGGDGGMGGSGGFVSIGASGGDGGNGGIVRALNAGSIVTKGDKADAISAQSIGGGGGDGGKAFAPGVAFSLAIGGSGGGGGSADEVRVENGGSISTSGRDATGMRAQSIGGGGGNGGQSLAASGGVYVSASTAIGGTGGYGGAGGTVWAANSGAGIVTGAALGELYGTATDLGRIDPLTNGQSAGNAHGIFAQSIGGGGGSGGDAIALSAAVGNSFSLAVSTALGGTGGAGGNGGRVSVYNYSKVATYGDFSHAIFAQSVGGGGGSGGDTITVTGSGSGGISGSVNVGLGGKGSNGGSGDTVFVQTGATSLSTRGTGSDAVLAQSIGGGGGNGGSVLSVGLSLGRDPLAIGVNLGGQGGQGRNGGNVQVNDSSAGARSDRQTAITTYGDMANGIVAQSVGGGGGNGGAVNVYAVSVQGGEGSAQAASLNLGGNGGSGGKGGEVTVNYDGKLATYGNLTAGILSQSIGGGGGNGGTVSSISLAASLNGNASSTSSKGGAVTASVNFGGSGGSGNDGGRVQTRLDGNSSIETHGVLSSGVIAQSIGGGGGNGGDARSFALASSLLSTTSTTDNVAYTIARQLAMFAGRKDTAESGSAQKSLSFSANFGGSGGGGGNGGQVLVNLAGRIGATGALSTGVLAQSIGGGGGNGGQAEADGLQGVGAYTVNLAMGGAGGAAGNGGAVSVTSTADTAPASITVKGVLGAGILAQSIGGGGGKAGAAATAPGDAAAPVPVVGDLATNQSLSFSVGGAGGAGGNGGEVTLYNGARISAQGQNTVGIQAQSIGGGGGKADATSAKGATANIALGGSGGAGGNGNTVKIANVHIDTSGSNGIGVLAQSIGGGGGQGGIVNAGGGVVSLGLEVGGKGGSGGNGGAVNVGCAGEYATRADCAGDITTSGAVAHGILAQSIGGGGGITQISRLNLSDGIGSWTFNIKGSSNNGNSGPVTVQDNPMSPFHVRTSGAGAIGIVAQSLSGSGGNIQLDGALGPVYLNYAGMTANGSGGSNGGVNIVLNGDIATSGAHAHGVFMESLFGAITAFGTDRTLLLGGYDKNANGQNRIVTNANSAITTTGDDANAIYSLTNYAAGSWSQGLDLAGLVRATGAGAWAVKAVNGSLANIQSGGGAINANVYGTVAASQVSTGAVSLENYNGGLTSLIVRNGGTVQVVGSAGTACPEYGCVAVHMVSQNNSVEVLHGGTVAGGAIMLNTPTCYSNCAAYGTTLGGPIGGNNNVVINGTLAGAMTVYSGKTTIAIGSTGRAVGGLSALANSEGILVNDGFMQGAINAYNFTYTDRGTHVLTVDGSRLSNWYSDTIRAGQVNIPIGGNVQIALSSLPTADFQPIDLITAKGMLLAGNAIVPAGAATQLSFGFKTSGDYQIVTLTGIRVGFGGVAGPGSGLAGAADLASDQVDALAGSDGPPLLGSSGQSRSALYDLLLGMANEADLSALSAQLSNFAVDTSAAESALTAVWYAANNLQSCGDDKIATISAIEQGDCTWTKVSYQDDRRRDGANASHAWGLTLGRQHQVGERFYLGLSAGFGTTDFVGGTFRSEGQRVTLGGIAKYVNGNVFGSASLVGGYAWADGKRAIDVPGSEAVADSSHRTLMASARLRGGYNFPMGTANFTPSLDLNVPVIHDRGYRETGGGEFAMEVLPSTNEVPDLHPAVQFGNRFAAGKASVRAWAEVGGRYRFDDVQTLVRMPNGFAPDESTRITYHPDRQAFVWNVGLLVEWSDRLEARFVYENERGRNAESRNGSVKLAWKF